MSTELIPAETLAPVKDLKLEERITLNPDAIAIRDDLLATVKKTCVAVTSSAEQKTVTAYAKELKRWLKDADENQKEINAILLPLQRRAKQLTTEASAPVDSELARLTAMLTQFTVEEQKRVAKEEAERQAKIKAAQAETDRLNREAQERQRKIEADRLEAERLQRVAAEQMAAAKNKKQREAAAEAQRLADEAAKNQASQEDIEAAARAEIEAFEAEQAERAAILAPAPEVSRQVGQVNRKVKRWKLQDTPDAIHRLYRANPSLVRMEVNAAAVQAIVFPENCPDGLECWWESTTQIRGT